jgi:Holliday junction DNA helicase RuvB
LKGMLDMDERQVGTDVNQVQITSLNHIIGQRQVREVLRVSIDSYFQHRATNSDSVFGPVALVGQSGCGKTITGKAIHCELANLNLIETNGEFMNKGQLLDTLVIADENTTVFIDEAQSLNTENQHVLLTAISERKLYLPRNHASKAPRTIPLAPFVLILATTHEFQLQDALRNRMRIYCRFDYYSIDNLVEILRQRIRSLGWAYESEDVLQFLGSRSKKTPRLSLNYLQMAFNVASSNSRTIITKDDVIEAFRLLQVDGMGLDPVEQFYLHELAKRGSTKLNVLSSKIGLPHRTISEVIEPYLLRAELITKEGVDRVITDKGMKHILSAGKVEPE